MWKKTKRFLIDAGIVLGIVLFLAGVGYWFLSNLFRGLQH